LSKFRFTFLGKNLKSIKAKKISFQKVEEKENSIPTLIQKGEIDDIKKLLEEDPSGKGSTNNGTTTHWYNFERLPKNQSIFIGTRIIRESHPELYQRALVWFNSRARK